ncbi:MAG: MBOAT family protein [Bacteroidales bacterium]
MLFNSIEFAIFLPIVFILYWFIVNRNLSMQNALVLTSSYLFYGWWDWRFLFLIVFSTWVDFSVGILLDRDYNKKKRKLLLGVSIAVNLGLLGVLKYYNFFAENLVESFALLDIHLSMNSLKVILPVGISFYTFQTLSYSIDVYRHKIKPTKDLLAFSSFVAFFPQLVAGPIERASNLLPQFQKRRSFNYDNALKGVRQIIWGLFKKIVIADNCAEFVNHIFENSANYSGSTLLLGAIFFTFQIYGDFSGYSDIAIGTARLFGFDLMRNFAYPYFSRDIAEFWRRWHISLSSWFKEYVYIPLGGSRGGLALQIRNTFIIFLLSGFWHGAKWTFVAWGALNAIYFIPLMLMKRNRNHIDVVAKGKLFPGIREIIQMGTTFFMVVMAWILFRADNLTSAIHYYQGIFSSSIASIPAFKGMYKSYSILMFIAMMIWIEWRGRDKEFAIASSRFTTPLRWSFYMGVIVLIFLFSGQEQEFIYFQF